MIAALLVACSMSNPTDCRPLGGNRLHPTTESCYAEEVDMTAFVQQYGYFVAEFRCIDFSVPQEN